MVRKFVCDPQKALTDCLENDKFSTNSEDIVSKKFFFFNFLFFKFLYREIDEEADEAEFVRRFRDLLDYGPEVIGKCPSG